jgi:hypothetical protein
MLVTIDFCQLLPNACAMLNFCQRAITGSLPTTLSSLVLSQCPSPNNLSYKPIITRSWWSQRKWPTHFNFPVQFVPQSIFQFPQNTDIQSDAWGTPRVYDAVRTGPFNRNTFVLQDRAKSATTPAALLPYSDGFVGHRSLTHHTSQY